MMTSRTLHFFIIQIALYVALFDCSYYGHYEYDDYYIGDDDNSYQPQSSAPTPSIDDDYWIPYVVWEGGTNIPWRGANHSISHLPPPQNRWILNVFVYETDYDAITEYVTSIRVNNRVLSSYCNPNIQYGTIFYGCLVGH
jgi:hypothetical protein